MEICESEVKTKMRDQGERLEKKKERSMDIHSEVVTLKFSRPGFMESNFEVAETTIRCEIHFIKFIFN